MNLYEIDNRLENLFYTMCEVDPETGELLYPEAADELEALSEMREVKLENALCYIKNLRAEAKALKEEEQKLTARRRALENADRRMTQYVSDSLGGERFQTPRVAVSYRKSASVEVDPEFIQWAEESGNDSLLRYKLPEVDKAAVKDLLKRQDLQYARMRDSVSMIIK